MESEDLGTIAEYFGLRVIELEDWVENDPTFPQPINTADGDPTWNVNEIVDWYNEMWGHSSTDSGAVPRYARADTELPDEHLGIEVGPHLKPLASPEPPRLAEERSHSRRTYVAADEFGKMCLIPLEFFAEQNREADAAHALIAQRSVALEDLDRFAADDSMLAKIEQWVLEFLEVADLRNGEDWNLSSLWDHLFDHGIVDQAEMPHGWTPTREHTSRARVDVPESFYEGCGRRDTKWADELPGFVVEQFGSFDGGMSGDYFGFEWENEVEVTARLLALGHTVVSSKDKDVRSPDEKQLGRHDRQS